MAITHEKNEQEKAMVEGARALIPKLKFAVRALSFKFSRRWPRAACLHHHRSRKRGSFFVLKITFFLL